MLSKDHENTCAVRRQQNADVKKENFDLMVKIKLFEASFEITEIESGGLMMCGSHEMKIFFLYHLQ